jgi:hypothetical protein
MSKCAAIEPAPTRFYAPVGLFSARELSHIGAEWLGEFITSPGGSFRYQVASGPLCRIYWGNGKPEPHSFESAYVQDKNGRWKRSHLNYVSYLLVSGEYLTVRWQLPTRCGVAVQTKAEERLLRKPA